MVRNITNRIIFFYKLCEQTQVNKNIFVCFVTGVDHLELIFEFAKWVLKEHPEDGLKVKI